MAAPTVLSSPEAQSFLSALHDLDALDRRLGTVLDTPTPTYSPFLVLGLYPHPWSALRDTISSLLLPTGRGFDAAKLRGGRMGLALVWVALEKATDIEHGWERSEVLLWCARLATGIQERIRSSEERKEGKTRAGGQQKNGRTPSWVPVSTSTSYSALPLSTTSTDPRDEIVEVASLPEIASTGADETFMSSSSNGNSTAFLRGRSTSTSLAFPVPGDDPFSTYATPTPAPTAPQVDQGPSFANGGLGTWSTVIEEGEEGEDEDEVEEIRTVASFDGGRGLGAAGAAMDGEVLEEEVHVAKVWTIEGSKSTDLGTCTFHVQHLPNSVGMWATSQASGDLIMNFVVQPGNRPMAARLDKCISEKPHPPKGMEKFTFVTFTGYKNAEPKLFRTGFATLDEGKGFRSLLERITTGKSRVPVAQE